MQSRGRVVRIATGHELNDRGVAVWVRERHVTSLLHVAQTGSEFYPASYTMDIADIFPEVTRKGAKLTSYL
jgi:hypothetical protein